MNPNAHALQNLNELIAAGKIAEAFEKYYDDNVVMQENDNPPMPGKAANRQREQEFADNITEWRNACVPDYAIGDNVSYVTWQFDCTHREWGARQFTQVARQHWKDGRIVKEHFFTAIKQSINNY